MQEPLNKLLVVIVSLHPQAVTKESRDKETLWLSLGIGKYKQNNENITIEACMCRHSRNKSLIFSSFICGNNNRRSVYNHFQSLIFCISWDKKERYVFWEILFLEFEVTILQARSLFTHTQVCGVIMTSPAKINFWLVF